ncbi:hypothetical protein HERIO_869 [Hepatospora eriocheir]|uniref:Uncharacterized protein n=1 Tax=Hepatospora eriocheir TaxID=1081669 RepID=A0A1X0QC36_9MICR|nr:hypothetical protein HERIO_869 [Hepatospora eriocheir]
MFKFFLKRILCRNRVTTVIIFELLILACQTILIYFFYNIYFSILNKLMKFDNQKIDDEETTR